MRHTLRLVLASTSLFAFVAVAHAQQPAAPPPTQLVVEEIQSGWLFSPDARATDLGGQTGALVGGYIGHMTDRSWVIGGGGYFLTNREDDFKLAYGGPVFEWLTRADRRIGFGVRSLVGLGSATLPVRIGDFVNPRAFASNGRHPIRTTVAQYDPNATVAVDDGFFVAEPQLNMMWSVSAGQRLIFGLGYRVVGGAGVLGDQLNGVSGSVSYQFGGK
jgi:hypothetical protein